MTARYRSLSATELQERSATALDRLRDCRVCPRSCRVNRQDGELGWCRTGRLAEVASYNLHFGEERPLVGSGGSGTIFFAHCNLGCLFCQNWDISHEDHGFVTAGPEQLADVMMRLQEQGAHNINFVTPSHVVPQILEALPFAVEHGLTLPLVYNSGGYDALDTLKLLDGIVDIYMPDLKFAAPEAAKAYALAGDYPERAREAVREMHRQVGDLKIDERGIAVSGLLVRHLVMPGNLAGTREWMRFLSREISPDTYVNIMDQYRPCGEADQHPAINRPITRAEYQEALTMAREEGITRLDERNRDPAITLVERLLRGK